MANILSLLVTVSFHYRANKKDFDYPKWVCIDSAKIFGIYVTIVSITTAKLTCTCILVETFHHTQNSRAGDLHTSLAPRK